MVANLETSARGKLEDISFRQAPHNIEAEQALLGAILVNNDAYYRVSDFLFPEHFYEPLHARIYELMAQMVKASKAVTPITLKTFVANEAPIGEMTIPQYLARLAAEAVAIISAEDYGRAILELALRRNLIAIGEEVVNRAFTAEIDETPRQQIEHAERQLFKLAETGRYEGGFRSFNTALTEAVEMANKAYQNDGHVAGISTGLIDLDNMLGGLVQSDLIILAGRPAMGKTALATNIAYAVAKNYVPRTKDDGSVEAVKGGVVGFFSLEMSSAQLATRIVSEQAEISSELIRKGRITEDEMARLIHTSREIASIPLYIDETGGISIAQLVARARRQKRQKGLDFMVVDYLQLLTGSSKKGSENRVQEITEITTSLKALAKELNVPILALSQLSRQVESREDKRPMLSDLRESGSIEQDADVVMFVFREEYYKEKQEPKLGTSEHGEWQRQMDDIVGQAEVIIGKQRHGPTGSVRLQFEKKYTRFGNLARDSYVRPSGNEF
jgi:replicative DNA helicase